MFEKILITIASIVIVGILISISVSIYRNSVNVKEINRLLDSIPVFQNEEKINITRYPGSFPDESSQYSFAFRTRESKEKVFAYYHDYFVGKNWQETVNPYDANFIKYENMLNGLKRTVKVKKFSDLESPLYIRVEVEVD